MTPRNLSDSELLRHYDDLFCQHEATRELANRYVNGNSETQENVRELECALDQEAREAREARSALEGLADAIEAHFAEGEIPKMILVALNEARDIV